MGFLSRARGAASRPVLSVSAEELAQIGRAAYGGETPHPPGFSHLMQQLDAYALRAMEASGHVAPGDAAWTAMMERLLAELTAASAAGEGWAWVGALGIAQNLVTDDVAEHPEYLQLIDRALLVLRDDGVACPSVPQPMLRRWEAVHGTSGLLPAKWPSALETFEIPEREVPMPHELERGEALRIAQLDPSPQSNTIWVERRPDGAFQVLTEALDSESGTRRRWEWMGLSAPTYGGVLRELGDRLVSPQHWAHDDLAGFFPCRQRSRDEMRVEARCFAVAEAG